MLYESFHIACLRSEAKTQALSLLSLRYAITRGMKVLGIETSCDETAVCVIEAGGDFPGRAGGPSFEFRVLGEGLTSQAALHAQYGGVFPNLAKREHAKNLVPLLSKCLDEAGASNVRPTRSNIADLSRVLEREPELLQQLVPFLQTHEKPDIDVIAVTHGPGLEPCLWVGVNFAKALSAVWDVPIVGVNHMEGHVIMSLMQHSKVLQNVRMSDLEFPLLALLISGGHTELVLSREFGKYELVGQTRDDAAGEAFDKVARLLELGYPGGPEISRFAEAARKSDEVSPHRISLPRPMMHEDNFDFSFSGLKTAVRRIVESNEITDQLKHEIAREFEDAVADVLIAKTMRAVDEYGAQIVVVGGGVSARAEPRRRLDAELSTVDCKLLTPPVEFATDNALMIALSGYFRALHKEFVEPENLNAVGNLKLA